MATKPINTVGMRIHPFYRRYDLRLHQIPKGVKCPVVVGWPKTELKADDVEPFLNGSSMNKYGWLLDDNYLVIDIDMHIEKENGLESLAKFQDVVGVNMDDDCKAIVYTPSGGRHYYFRKPQEYKFGKTFKSLYPGIDFISGSGKQVIAANSYHDKHDGTYQLSEDAELVDLPKKILDYLFQLSEKKPQAKAIVDASVTNEWNHEVSCDRSGDEFNTSPRGLAWMIATMQGCGYVVRHCGDYYEFDRPNKSTGSQCSGYVGKKSKQGNYQLTSFSLSDANFPSGESLSLFHAYALLVHSGNHSQAADALYKLGFAEKQVSEFSDFQANAKPNSNVAEQPKPRPTLNIISVAELIRQYPNDDPPIIEGLLRLGETMNVIASPKVGKTWLAAGLAYSIASGAAWLGMQCTLGRVLILDCELKPSTLRFRYQRVAEEMQCDTESIDIVSLRGDGRSVVELSQHIIETVESGKYSAIVWDALYRLLPPKTSENDNAGMMQIYNELDKVSERTGSANIVIHHTSKGVQSEKSITDVGSGAGSISRAADTHLTIRPHEIATCAVVDAVCRSFISPEPKTIRWQFPLWMESGIEPALKKMRDNKQVIQAESDAAAKAEMLAALGDGNQVSQSSLLSKLSFGHSMSKTKRVFLMLTQEKQIKRTQKRKKNTKRTLVFWQLLPQVVPPKQAEAF